MIEKIYRKVFHEFAKMKALHEFYVVGSGHPTPLYQSPEADPKNKKIGMSTLTRPATVVGSGFFCGSGRVEVLDSPSWDTQFEEMLN